MELIRFLYSVLLFTFIRLLAVSGKLPMGGWYLIPLFVLADIPVFTLTPRFILSMRELYARDSRGRRGSGVDTGFGLGSSGFGSETMIVFADNREGVALEGVEEIAMKSGSTLT